MSQGKKRGARQQAVKAVKYAPVAGENLSTVFHLHGAFVHADEKVATDGSHYCDCDEDDQWSQRRHQAGCIV